VVSSVLARFKQGADRSGLKEVGLLTKSILSRSNSAVSLLLCVTSNQLTISVSSNGSPLLPPDPLDFSSRSILQTNS
jgi:hypothetical protein